MSSQNEEKITRLFNYPYDAFLMIRLEFDLIFEDELEAKLLRIIEKYVEQERRRIYRETINKTGKVPESPLDVTKDIWVEISYKTFMADLYGKVTSENTVKRGLKKLEDMRIIFRNYEQKKRYDAPRYKIHATALQILLDVVGKPGYQSLIPSMIDTLKHLPPHELTPSEAQSLIPSNTDISTSRVSAIDTIYNSNSNIYNNKGDTHIHEDVPFVDGANAHINVLSTLSLEDLQAELARRQTLASTQEDSIPIATPTATPEEMVASSSSAPSELSAEPALVPDVPVGGTIRKSEDIPAGTSEEKKTPAKRTRKKTLSLLDTLDDVTRARVTKFYDALDALKREVSGNEKAKYARPDTDTQNILTLLETEEPTVEGLRRVYLHLWNLPRDERSGFYWRENMTVKAICRQYPVKVLAVMPEKRKEPTSRVPQPMTSIAPQSNRPELQVYHDATMPDDLPSYRAPKRRPVVQRMVR